MRQRLMLSVLLALALLYVALPRLPFGAEGLAGVFALMWIGFAIIVVGGNITGLLYSKKVPATSSIVGKKKQEISKLRRYSR